MSRRFFAFDFDGTIATEGQVPSGIVALFERARSQAHQLFLVTGRIFHNAPIADILPYLTGIVWENGAIVENLKTSQVFLPFGRLPETIVKEMEQSGIDMLSGMAIAATWSHNQDVVTKIMDRHGYKPVFEYNKDALMILPPGADKASGLTALLAQETEWQENLVAFGDGENDQALLRMATIAVAVQDAVPALHEIADLVSTKPGPEGVAEILTILMDLPR